MHRHLSAAVAAAALSLCVPASAQVQRTFVASYGNDGNVATNCSVANPCRSFAAAQAATQAGGEIVALDAAGYGAITITKSLSILANPGVYAGISVASDTGVTIDTANTHVRLSGLNINGTGGLVGIDLTQGASLTVENCTISGFPNAGLRVQTAASVRIVGSRFMRNYDGAYVDLGARADVVDSTFLGNARSGLIAASTGGNATFANVHDSVSSQNQFGFISLAVSGTVQVAILGSSADNNSATAYFAQSNTNAGAAVLALAASKASGNTIGLRSLNGSFRSAGNNLVTGNLEDTEGTITGIGTM